MKKLQNFSRARNSKEGSSVSASDWNSSSSLSFLSNWTAPVDEDHLDELTNTGLREARRLGRTLRNRYQDLNKPRQVWSSTAERTVKTAKGFIEGFTIGGHNSTTLRTDPTTKKINLTTVDESEEAGADSLTPYKGCEAYSSSYGNDQSSTLTKIYTKPIIQRLNSEFPSFNFTSNDITGMFELCGYETVIRGYSPFCSLNLFSQDEWLGYEYASDLRYFHNTGYRRDLSSTLGFPWINASFEALDKSGSGPGPKSKQKQEQELYVSFTHREVPPTVLTALGLFNNSAYTGANNVNGTMPLDKINYNRVWRSSEILPFLTNIAIEKMECDSFGFDAGVYYRVLNNGSPMPLVDCRDGPEGSCSRKGFSEFLRERREGILGYNEACGGENEYPSSLDIYGA